MLEYYRTLVRLVAHEGHPCLALCVFLRRRGLMFNRYQCSSSDCVWCWFSGHVTYVDHWMLVQVETMCFQWENMTPALNLWTMTLLAMLVLILLVLCCAGLWSPKLLSYGVAYRSVEWFIQSGIWYMEMVLTCVWRCGTLCVSVISCALVVSNTLPRAYDVLSIFVMERWFLRK